MTDEARAVRIANLLIARLDAVARTAAQLPHADTERLVELASVATMRAVALQILEAARAEEIWRDAHDRHPALAQAAADLSQRLAA